MVNLDGQLNNFLIFTLSWGNDQISKAYFSNGLLQPPTSNVKLLNSQKLGEP